MKMMRQTGIFFLWLICNCVGGQTIADKYQRSEDFKHLAKDKVLHGYFVPHWFSETNRFWYSVETSEGEKFYVVDADRNKKKELLSINTLVKKLADFTQHSVNKEELRNITINENLKSCHLIYEGYNWTCQIPSYKLEKQELYKEKEPYKWTMAQADQLSGGPVKSPDGKRLGYIKNYNLFVKDLSSDKEIQISYDGGLGLFYSSFIQWSPDSKKIMTCLVQPAEKHFVNYIESSPKGQLQPVYSSIEYYKPGDALPQFYPTIFNVEQKIKVASCRELIPNQYGIEYIRWDDESEYITFEYNKRGHQTYQVIKLDAQNGKSQVVINEHSNTFIDYSSKHYRYDVNSENEIIWASERDGWNHLYLYDSQNGQVKNQITKGEWVVRNVIRVDEEKRNIIFAASGKEQGDPYYLYYYSINFDGSGLKLLTEGNGNHRVSFSSDFRFMVDSWSRVDMAPISVLRETSNGNHLMTLEKADISKLLDTGWTKPEVFKAKGRDGKTDIWGMILKPSNFDSTKTYPVIEYIYAGPHSNHVPKDFRSYYNRCRQSLTELGFVVVMIDGMGTSNRSKAFHDVCYKNLKDAGFPDRIKWIQSAAKERPYMDISKVGIYGKSAGGQNSTGAVLFYPDFYKVAVSVCGCHDNRMDKIWWNEQWMGWPIGKEYAECSNVDNAYRLKGDLFLITGEMDQNVDPASTYQVVDALIKANKDFGLLTLPGKGHEWGGEYGERRICNYFVDKILSEKSPHINQMDFGRSLIQTDIDR